MRGSSYIQWYNENEGRSYPLREDVTGVSNAGRTLPDDVIVDMGLLVPPEQADIYVSGVRITPSLITVGISSATSGLFVCTFARADVQAYVSYPLTGVVDNVAGWIVFGNHASYTTEDYQFDSAAQSGIVERAVRVVDVLPVTNLVRFGGNPEQTADGLIQLIGGQGIIIEPDSVDPQKIVVRVDPDMAQAFLGPCNQASRTDACGVPPMRSINGVCPDENGRITIRFE